MARTDDFLTRVRKDLPSLRAITARPEAQNPMLAVILSQAQALAEVRQWAATVEQQWPDDEADALATDAPVSNPPARPTKLPSPIREGMENAQGSG